MNITTQNELLPRLAEHDALDLAVKALHDTADAMDAFDRKMDSLAGRSSEQTERWDARNIVAIIDHTSCGAMSLDDLGAEMQRRKREDRAAYRVWSAACDAVRDTLIELVWPAGYSSPSLSSDDVRALTGRLAASSAPGASTVSLTKAA
ncbi:hypothetical protein [Streptomyces platensis]|uniref:hypothetical protein n=1 Tax=Streptomyces platensis TaxID=58346 RepID=UPI0033184A62